MKKFLIRVGFFSQLNFLVGAEDEKEAEKLLMGHLDNIEERLTNKFGEIIQKGLDREDGSIIHLQDLDDGRFGVEPEETRRVSASISETPYFIILRLDKEVHFSEAKPEQVDKIYENREDAEERASYLNEQYGQQCVYWVEEIEFKAK